MKRLVFILVLIPILVVAAEEEIVLEAQKQHGVEGVYWEGEGNVKVVYQDMKIEADIVRLDWQNQMVTAEGHVILKQGNSILTAEHMTYNLEDKTGVFEDATGSFQGMYNFVGDKVIKVGENKFQLFKGVFTSCDLDSPPWSFTIRKADVEMQGYAHIKGLSLRIKKFPIIYFPYLLWPAKTDRARGFLTPHIGHTFKRGAYLGMAYFIPMGDSYDLTLQSDTYSEGFLGGGFRFRYHPLESLKGEGLAYMIKDDEGKRWWKVEWNHLHDSLPYGFKLNADIELLSDIDFFREFERTFSRNTNRSIFSYMTLSKNWGLNSMVIRADRRETVFSSSGSQNEIILHQVPEVEYRLRPKPILKTKVPLYFSLFSGVHIFNVDRGNDYKGTYSRYDVFPTFSSSISTIPWLTIRPSVGMRYTYYSKTLDESQALLDESASREYLTFETDLVGPSFSRIFKSEKRAVKHLIEPRFEYQYLSDFDDIRNPIFDENDAVRGRHQMRYSLANRFFFKKGEDSAYEIASLTLSQVYSFDGDTPLSRLYVEGETLTSPRSSLEAALRFYPKKVFNFDSRVSFNAITHKWQTLTVTGGVRVKSSYGNITYRKTNPQTETFSLISEQMQVSTGVKLFKSLDIVSGVNYDIAKHGPVYQRYSIKYTGSCYAVALEYFDRRLGDTEDREYKITFDLKNVGSFLEITGGVDDLFGGG